MQKNMMETIEKPEQNVELINDVQQENFCPRCGSFLKVVGKRGLPLLSCSKCGYSKPITSNHAPKQSVREGNQ